MVADNGTNSSDATETLKTFQWVTEGLLLMLISSIGLIGNSCSVVTCARQRVQRIFHRLLLVLATFDTVSSLLKIVPRKIVYRTNLLKGNNPLGEKSLGEIFLKGNNP